MYSMAGFAFNGNDPDLTTGAANVTSGAAPGGTTHVRLMILTNPARVRINAPAVTASILIAPNVEYIMRCPAGQTVNALQQGAAGTLTITWLIANPTTQGGNYSPGTNP